MIDDQRLVRPAITVLGEVTVRDSQGDELVLSAQRREILAVVAAAAGAIVPMQTLLRTVWGEDTPRSRGSLKTQMSTIRKALDRGLTIEHAGGGYRLKGPLDLLDSTRFEQLVATARELPPAEAAAHYSLALAQWHGPMPFVNVDNPLVDPTSWRLLALRDDVVLALADAEIATRVGTTALSLLEKMFTDDTTRGDVAMRLAKLYTLATRHMEAVRVIRAHRESLADIGAVIAPEVAEVESQILRHEIGAPATPPVDRFATPSATTTLLPRDEWVDRSLTALATRPVMLVGDPGVGKTTLTRLIEQRLDTERIPVVRAAVLEDPFRPMQTVATIIDQLGEVLPQSTGRALSSKRLADAAARVVGGPAAAAVPPTTRDELLDDLTDLIETALTGTGAVLVVEDVQWLDANSAEVIASLFSRHGIHLLLTSRTPTHPEIERADALDVLELPPFGADEVDELLRQTLPLRANDELAGRLLHQTGGNPLFLGLLLDVISRGELGSEVPQTLQAAVAERTSALARTTRELLQLAALLGQTFPLAPLRLVRRRAGEQLTSAEEEGLIHLDHGTGSAAAPADPAGASSTTEHLAHTGRFVHGLVADALAAMVPTGPRVSWHDELCRAMQTCRMSAVAVAPQALAAAEIDPIRAARLCCDAGEEQVALFEWKTAIEWARRGIDVVGRFNMTGQLVEAELRSMLGTGLRRSNLPGSDIELLRAAELASEYEADDLLVRTVIELCLHGFTTQVGGVDERARRHLEYALGLDLGDHARAELCAAAATLMASSDDSSLGRSLYLEARDVAIRSESEHLVRSVLMNAHLGLAHPADLPLRWHAAEHLARLDDIEAQWEAAWVFLSLGLVTADRALADRSIERLRELTPKVRRRHRDRGLVQAESVHAYVRGELAEAERLAVEAFEAAVNTYDETWAVSVFAALLIPVRTTQGRLGELWELVLDRVAAQPEFTSWHALACAIADARDDRDQVRSFLDVLHERKFNLVEDTTWTALTTMICVPIWHAADADLARVLYERLAPYAGQMTWNGLNTHGPVDGGLALLAATMGDRALTEEHLTTAREMVDRLGAPHLWWRVLDDLPVD